VVVLIFIFAHSLLFLLVVSETCFLYMLVLVSCTLVNHTPCNQMTSCHNFLHYLNFQYHLALSQSLFSVNVVEVKWSSPLSGWIKVNTYGASLGSTGQGACAGESSETVMVFL
jgi:hypothetical protein